MPFATNLHIIHMCFVFFNLRVVLRSCDFKTLAEFVQLVRCYGWRNCAYYILSLILLNEILLILTSSL